MDRFIQTVRQALSDQGMSISELARRAQTSRPYVHRVLRGDHVPTLAWCYRVADALDLDLVLAKKSASPSC